MVGQSAAEISGARVLDSYIRQHKEDMLFPL